MIKTFHNTFTQAASIMFIRILPLLQHTTIPQSILDSSLRLICDGTRTETRFRLSGKRTRPFKSAGVSVQSTTGSRGVRISGSNAGYTMFRGSVEGNGYRLHSPVSPLLPLSCVTVCLHISTGVYLQTEKLCGVIACCDNGRILLNITDESL